jgi:hypothetical protein
MVSCHPFGKKRDIFLANRTHIEGLSIPQSFQGIDKLLEDGTVIANGERLGV